MARARVATPGRARTRGRSASGGRPGSPASGRLAAALLAAVLAGPSIAGHALGAIPERVLADEWRTIELPELTLFANLAPGRAVQLARRLTRLSRALESTLGLPAGGSSPLFVYAIEGDETFASYRGEKMEHADGYSLVAPDRRRLVFVVREEREGEPRVAYHEYVHAYLWNNFASLPLWVNEGLAQYFSTLEIKRDKIQIGRGIPPAARWYGASDPLSMEVMIGVDQSSIIYGGGDQTTLFYAEAWALVHYLLHSTPDNQRSFIAYLERLRRGENARKAFEAEFPTSRWATLPEEARRHVWDTGLSGLPYSILPITVGRAETEPEVRAMERAEVLCRLGELLTVLGGDRLPSAEEHFRAALGLDSSTTALAGLGLVRDLTGESAAAESLYAVAAGRSEGDPMPCLIAGRGVMQRYFAKRDRVQSEHAPTPPLLLAARARFLCCLRRDPDNAEALEGFGRSFLFDDHPPSAAIAALEAACLSEPARTDLPVDLVVLLARAEKFEAADSVFGATAPRLPPSDAPRMRTFLSWIKAGRLRAAGRRDDAYKELELALSQTGDPENRRALQDRLEAWKEEDRRAGAPNR